MKARWRRSSAMRSRFCSTRRATSRTMPRARSPAPMTSMRGRKEFRERWKATGREFRRHPHRRACRTRAGRQFRRQPLLRLHRLWRHHQHRGAARRPPTSSWARASASAPPSPRPPEISGAGRSAISCCAGAANRCAPTSRCRLRQFEEPTTTQYSRGFCQTRSRRCRGDAGLRGAGRPACRRCAGRLPSASGCSTAPRACACSWNDRLQGSKHDERFSSRQLPASSRPCFSIPAASPPIPAMKSSGCASTRCRRWPKALR